MINLRLLRRRVAERAVSKRQRAAYDYATVAMIPQIVGGAAWTGTELAKPDALNWSVKEEIREII
ncbi:hypothetical protein SAMN04488002_0196 [Litoreibacter janthinus]|uniref:Uncharacterized protein n=1 Tax=Litoreibacter janthinus TaxID=670154 RepID=A0A1I6FSI4_9RHOB|nr:hypothetical protein SAMN04488002_0196 [Litoreibacter janthinus]